MKIRGPFITNVRQFCEELVVRQMEMRFAYDRLNDTYHQDLLNSQSEIDHDLLVQAEALLTRSLDDFYDAEKFLSKAITKFKALQKD